MEAAGSDAGVDSTVSPRGSTENNTGPHPQGLERRNVHNHLVIIISYEYEILTML